MVEKWSEEGKVSVEGTGEEEGKVLMEGKGAEEGEGLMDMEVEVHGRCIDRLGEEDFLFSFCSS